jgi:hypothetical protein
LEGAEGRELEGINTGDEDGLWRGRKGGQDGVSWASGCHDKIRWQGRRFGIIGIEHKGAKS